MVTCPYSERGCEAEIATDAPRCLCGRYVKRCSNCATRNRVFANFCRNCGAALPPSDSNWSGYKGGARRLGTNTVRMGECITRTTDLRLRLGDPCRSLLGYDGHVVAVSVNGVVEIADPLPAKSTCRFQAQGPITAEPCISDGVLYLATRGQVSAYALAGTTFNRVKPLWSRRVNGTPIQAMTCLGSRLYVTTASADRRELHLITQQTAHPLHSARKMSWVAADSAGTRAVFFSEDEGRVQLHIAGDELTTHPVSLPFPSEHPIALLGSTIFGVFGDTHRLYRIDAETGAIEEPLEEDTHFFALTNDGDEWDRDSVRLDTSGIVFTRSGMRDSFAPHERATKGSPVIVQGCAVAVGMDDGRVLLYDLAELPRHEVWRPGGAGAAAAITSLISFDSYIAAGTKDGVVEVRELLLKGTAR